MHIAFVLDDSNIDVSFCFTNIIFSALATNYIYVISSFSTIISGFCNRNFGSGIMTGETKKKSILESKVYLYNVS